METSIPRQVVKDADNNIPTAISGAVRDHGGILPGPGHNVESRLLRFRGWIIVFEAVQKRLSLLRRERLDNFIDGEALEAFRQGHLLEDFGQRLAVELL